MRTRLRGKFSLLFMTLGLLLAIPAVAFADDIRDGLDTTAQQTQTITAEDSTGFTNEYWIVANAAGTSPNGCDVGSQFDSVTATFQINTPSGVTATPSSLTFDECRDGPDLNSQTVKFTSNTPGTYSIPAVTKTSGSGTYTTTNTPFTLVVKGVTQFTSVSGTGTAGQNDGKLNARLVWGSGSQQLPGKTVSFEVNKGSGFQAVCGSAPLPACPQTGADGQATLNNVNLSGLSAGTYNGAVRATFAGDTNYFNTTSTGNLVVSPANTAPTAVNDSYNATEDTQLQVAAPGVLGNDTDNENNPLTAVQVTGPSHASSFSLNANGSFSYTPAANYNGPDSFTYKANDGTVNSTSAATVTISVAAVDDPPTANDDSDSVLEDANATAINVLANDTDIDGGPKTIQSVTQPDNGTVVITGGGTGLTYKPDGDYCNDGTPTDDFTYKLNGDSEATVAMTVTCVNDAPTTPGAITSDESLNNDGTFTLSWGASTDVDSANITYTLEHRDFAATSDWSEVASGLNSASYTFGGSNPAELEGLWDYRVKAVDDFSPPASSDYREDLDLVKVDKTNPNAPTLSFATTGQSPKVTVNSVDWYKDSVKIDVSANGDPVNARDGSPGSGVDASSFQASFSVTTNGESTASKTVKDNATNESAAGELTVHVDAANPTFGNCPSGGPFLVNSGGGTQSVGPISANDGESGIDSAGSTLSGSVNTSSPGTKTVTFTAKDRVGHSDTKQCSYTVRAYDFIGFTSPVDNPTVLNTVKAGQAIPLKWRLMDNGNPVTNLQSVTVTASSYNCTLGTTTDLLEEVASGSSGLQNLGDGYYQFNWKSPTTYAKSCKSLQINGVGMQLTAQQQPLFQFTR